VTATTLSALLERTERAIAEMEAHNEGGDDPPPPSLPPALRSAHALRERVRAALAQCAARAAAEGAAASVGSPRANVTDPEARWMKIGRVIEPGYNAQAAVVALNATAQELLGADAPGGRIVVAATVSTQPTDQHQLVPMITDAVAAVGTMPSLTVADAQYHSGETLAAAEALGYDVVLPESAVVDPQENPYHRASFRYDATTDTLTCPAGQTLTFRRTTAEGGRRYQGSAEVCRACGAFGVCTTNAKAGRIVTLTAHDAVRQAQRQRRALPAQRRALAQRTSLIEPVFGIIKDVLRGRRVLVRRRAKVEAEWMLLTTAFNLRTLYRLWQAMGPPERTRLLAMTTGR
jgi:IS5 family transposase